MDLQWFMQWWNLIFIVPFLVALVYLGLYTATGITFGDTDADVGLDTDADADMDADADADADVDADADADMDGDADADADAQVGVESTGHADLHIDVDADADMDADADASADGDAHVEAHAEGDHEAQTGGSAALAVLSWLGLGRVPLSILVMVLLISWGVIGFLINAIAWPRMPIGSTVSAISIPAAGLLSLLVTRGISLFVARFLPTYETYAHRRHDLLGCDGEALYPIDPTFGMVNVRDRQGDLFQVPCRVYKNRPPIAKGEHVQLVAYNGKEGVFYVIPSRLADSAA